MSHKRGVAPDEPTPRFENVGCSQCGQEFGPGWHGFSHCSDHATPESRFKHQARGRRIVEKQQRPQVQSAGTEPGAVVYVHSPEGMVKLDDTAVEVAEHGFVTVQAHRRALVEARRGTACEHVFELDTCIKCGGVA